jgi:polyhydroxybutyrate depolymerase
MKSSFSCALALLLFTAFTASARAEVITGAIDVEGAARTWRLFVPDNYRPDAKHPLVLDFHGTGGSPEQQSRNSEFTKLASQANFLVVNPAGKYVRAPGGGATWNVDLDPKGPDDVRFVRELIAHLSKQYSIDPARIYATGFSGGARMSSRLACDLSDVIASVGLVGGIRFPERCEPAHPVAIIALHGEKDEVNHFEHRSDSPAYWPVGVMDASTSWAKRYACDATPREQRLSAEVAKLEYQGCKAGANLELFKLKNGRHTWPGSPGEIQAGTNPGDFSATARIWEFFKQHPRR